MNEVQRRETFESQIQQLCVTVTLRWEDPGHRFHFYFFFFKAKFINVETVGQPSLGCKSLTGISTHCTLLELGVWHMLRVTRWMFP